jgi:hypothetical protein
MTSSLSLRTSARLWIGAYLIATFGSGLLLRFGVTHGWIGWTLFIASFLLLIPLVRSMERAQDACGVNSPAMRTYNRRMIAASFTYVALLLACAALARYSAPPAPVRVVLAIIVSLPVLFMIRSMALLIKEERDEYLRMKIVERTLIATGFTLAATTIYGFLTAFDLAPKLDSVLVVPLWGVGLGVGRLFQRDAAC